VASSLDLFRDGAVGFIDWLDFRSLLPDEFIIKFTLAMYNLPATQGTSLHVAAEDVKFAFPDTAIVTGLAICSPVLCFLPVTNPVVNFAADPERVGYAFFCHAAINLTRPKISDRARERASSRDGRINDRKVTRGSGARFAASPG
jgi:hypothetical protein